MGGRLPKRPALTAFALVFSLALCGPAPAAGRTERAPAGEQSVPADLQGVGEKTSPAESGLDPAALERLRTELAERSTYALLLARDGSLVLEWYDPRLRPDTLIPAASLAKALVASAVLMLVLDQGVLDLDAPASRYLPEWRDDPVRSRITIRQLATHSAGIEDVYFGGGTRPEEGWHAIYHRNPGRRFHLALTQAAVEFEPGTQYRYSGVGYYVLAYALARALHRAGLPDIETLLRSRIMKPLGVPSREWEINYGARHEIGGLSLYAIGSGARLTPRVIARFGQLILDGGRWRGEQIVTTDAVRTVTTREGTPLPEAPVPAPALGWWTNAEGAWPSLPRDAFAGVGANHQILLVVPSLDLVAVRMGEALGGTHWGDGFWVELNELFAEPLARSLGREPRAPSGASDP